MGFGQTINKIGNTVLGASSTIKEWQSGNKFTALQTGANTMAQSGLPGSQWVNKNLITPVSGIANNIRGIFDMASLVQSQKQHQLAVTA